MPLKVGRVHAPRYSGPAGRLLPSGSCEAREAKNEWVACDLWAIQRLLQNANGTGRFSSSGASNVSCSLYHLISRHP
jgi:hypothetical protein